LLPIRKTEKRLICRPVGRCIYCGATDNLSMEHVAPYALGGTMELPEASCPTCARITSLFEMKVARDMMLAPRTKFGAPTRNPKNRPKTLALEVRKGDRSEKIELSVEDHPGSFALPELQEPPRYLAGLEGLHRLPSTISFRVFHPSDLKERIPAEADQAMVGRVEVTAYFRMIAKIAHAFAIATRGHGSFDPLLLPLILGETKIWVDVIGSPQRAMPGNEKGEFSIQTLTLRTARAAFLACDVTIFPVWNGPSYRVVVGRLPLLAPLEG